MRSLKCKSINSLIKNLHIIPECISVISVNVYERCKVKWKPFLIRSCNEVCRYVSGVDIGLTLNPRHFYNKLLKYNHKRNYEILSEWRRDHGIPGR